MEDKKKLIEEIKNIAKELDVNLNNINIIDLVIGYEIELEHGFENLRTNITNDNMITTVKIALAHINEYPDYYNRLILMEHEAEKYWKNKKNRNYFFKINYFVISLK